MNKYCISIIFIWVLALSCTKNKTQLQTKSQDSVAVYMQKALNIQNNYNDRVLFSEKAIKILVKQENDSINRNKLILLCRNYNDLCLWDNLKKTSKVVLSRCIEKKDLLNTAQAYRLLGFYYYNLDINDSAFYNYSKAKKICLKLKDEKTLVKLYVDISSVQINVFDVHGAEKSAIMSIKLSKRLNDLTQEYDALINLAVASCQIENYDKAIFYIKKALSIAVNNPQFDSLFMKEVALNNLGYYYAFKKNYPEASRTYRTALKNKNLLKGLPRVYSTLIGNLAYSNFKINPDNSSSYKFYLKAIKIADSLKRKSKVAYLKNLLSDYYLYKNDTVKSLKLSKEALEISRETKSYDDLLSSLKQISKTDLKNQSEYLKEYISLSDSLHKKERLAKNKFEAIAYETEEITQQKNTAIKNYRRTWVIASVIIGLLILLLIIRAQAAKKRELELKQIQQKANEEISNLMLDQQNKIDVGRSLEKKRIAQDLHDGIMNMLASTRINLHLLVQKTPEETRKNFNRFVDGIQDIEKEIRNIAHDLNHGALANKGSFVGISEALIQEQKNISICRYHLEIDWEIDWEKMAGYKKIHLYRIMQEALQNILKHARAKNVEVSMRKIGDCVLMEIFDDGVGFSLNKKKKGLGLQNIMARAKASDAKAVIKTKINEGTTIEITIPIS